MATFGTLFRYFLRAYIVEQQQKDKEKHLEWLDGVFIGMCVVKYGFLMVLCITSYWGMLKEDVRLIFFSAFWVFTLPLMEVPTSLIDAKYTWPQDSTKIILVAWGIFILMLAIGHFIVFYAYKNQLQAAELEQRTEVRQLNTSTVKNLSNK